MRFVIAVLLAVAGMVFPISGFAESADVEGVIENIDEERLVVVLSDGKKYQAPEEFNFEGLKKGVKVLVFYTDTDGKRVINDLQIIE
jgi:hypothetical protein